MSRGVRTAWWNSTGAYEAGTSVQSTWQNKRIRCNLPRAPGLRLEEQLQDRELSLPKCF